MSAPKEYVGDSVYAEIDQWGALILTTENGAAATNTIVLEGEVLVALVNYLAANGYRDGMLKLLGARK